MTEYVLRVWGVPSRPQLNPRFAGKYVSYFDAEAENGRGEFKVTEHIDQALRYESIEAAVREYRTIPKNKPVRYDGKPNRPMTSLTVEVVAVEEKEN